MIYACRSEKGRRDYNEDAVFIPPKGEVSLVIVADGMGGHSAGNIASALAVKTVAAELKKGGVGTPNSLVLNSVNKANAAVHQMSKTDKNCRGMGTTLVLALLFKTRYVAANVGDSRLYHFGANELTQVSIDHSYVGELVAAGYITPKQARLHPKRNLITRALGTNESEEVDIFNEMWEEGDMLLLCTDGLYTVLDDMEIRRVLRQEQDLDRACDTLVKTALERGSNDNISVVLVKNEEARA